MEGLRYRMLLFEGLGRQKMEISEIGNVVYSSTTPRAGKRSRFTKDSGTTEENT